ncbi:tetratricopeptide repeat protein [Seleniivibrio woodruffii]|uniref:tetratricopeptide repeat protein n=1 Tax=Seleniivibrio woodruffii TaxID=1078050 RepID=UPI00240A23ED|nr:tetratricopeptide repeat protein [Seleniivibrio woodruffii]
MSLVLDSLKKVNSSNRKGGAVPPSMLNLKPSGRRGKGPRKSLLVLLAVAVIGFMIVMFMPAGSDYKVNAAADAVPMAAEPVVQSPDASAPAPRKAPEPQTAQPVQPAPVQQPPMAEKAPEYDPTAANQQRLAAMRSLPEIHKPAGLEPQQSAPMPPQTPAAAPAQPETPAQPEVQAAPKPTVQSNPSFVLSGKAKREYDRKSEYNTTVAQAAEALRNGNNRRAEEFYSRALAENATKPVLTGFLTAKIRQGKLNEVQPVIDNHPYLADASVVSAAAMEMSSLGLDQQALSLLNSNTRKSGSGQIYYTAGLIQENAGDFDKAETAYQKAVHAAPGDAYMLYAYARILDIQKKYGEAVNAYEKLASIPSADDAMKNNAKARAALLKNYMSSLN